MLFSGLFEHFSINNNQSEYIFLNKQLFGGTFGKIHVARVESSNEIVAIKVIKNNTFTTYRTFENEYNVLNILLKYPHPNFIKFKNHYKKKISGGILETHLVTEFLSDNFYGTMKQCCFSEISMPLALIKIYSFQIFRALSHLHSLQICHRDINPLNMLINPHTHQLKLFDFSCAKKIPIGNVYSENDCKVGSVHFRSPEMLCRCKNVTGFPTDMWAAGCILAECLMNCDLFTGTTTIDVLSEHIWMLGNIMPSEHFRPSPEILFAQCEKIGVEGRMEIRREKYFNRKTFPALNTQAIDLLSRIFVFVARDRILPLDACRHPFFSSLFLSDTTTLEGFSPPVELFCFTPQELSGNCMKFDQHRVTQLRDQLTPTYVANYGANNIPINVRGWYLRRDDGPENDIDYWFGDDAGCCATVTNSVVGENEGTKEPDDLGDECQLEMFREVTKEEEKEVVVVEAKDGYQNRQYSLTNHDDINMISGAVLVESCEQKKRRLVSRLWRTLVRKPIRVFPVR